MEGVLRRLGLSTDFDPELDALDVRKTGGVLRALGATPVQGVLPALPEPFPVSILRKPGVMNAFDKFEALCDVCKEDDDPPRVPDLRFSPTGGLFARFCRPGAEFEACRNNFGLPVVGSDMFMKLPDLISLSCVFIGVDNFPGGVEIVPQRFAGLGVTMDFVPRAGDRCLLNVPGRWAGRRLEFPAVELGVGFEILLEGIFLPPSNGFEFTFVGRGELTPGICINGKTNPLLM